MIARLAEAYSGKLDALVENDTRQIYLSCQQDRIGCAAIAMAALADKLASISAPATPAPAVAPTSAAVSFSPPPPVTAAPTLAPDCWAAVLHCRARSPLRHRLRQLRRSPGRACTHHGFGRPAADTGSVFRCRASDFAIPCGAIDSGTSAHNNSRLTAPASAAPQPPTALKAEFYYALFRAGLPTDTDTLFQASPTAVEAIWQQAVSGGRNSTGYQGRGGGGCYDFPGLECHKRAKDAKPTRRRFHPASDVDRRLARGGAADAVRFALCAIR